MMSRFLREKSATRWRSSSRSTRRILVSHNRIRSDYLRLTYLDVIVLTSMGEEVAIEAKEAPAKA